MKNKSNIRLSLVLLMCSVLLFPSCDPPAESPPPALPGITASGLQRDFTILRSTLEHMHPGLNLYLSKEAFHRLADSLANGLDRDMTEPAFVRHITPLIASIRCIHTTAGFSPQLSAKGRDVKFIPIRIYTDGLKSFIRFCTGYEKLEGSELLSIQNIPIEKILDTLSSYISCDGFNKTFKTDLLSTAYFREAYLLHYGTSSSYRVKVINDGDTIERKLDAKFSYAIREHEEQQLGVRSPLFMDMRFIDSIGIAVLEVPTFLVDTTRFISALRRYFGELKGKGYSRLIIDLRRNGGGDNNNVRLLYSYIANGPFRHIAKAWVATDSVYNRAYIRNARSFGQWDIEHTKDGELLVNRAYRGTGMQPTAPYNHFSGEIVVLTSGATISAGSELASLIRSHKRGLIVGQETGGCYYGSTGGTFIDLRLPNSQVRVRIPTVSIALDVVKDTIRQPRGRGVIPDIEIIPTIEDLIANRDRQMEVAQSVMLKPKKGVGNEGKIKN